jgi:Cytochrome P450
MQIAFMKNDRYISDITSILSSTMTYVLSFGFASILLVLHFIYAPPLQPYPPGPRGLPFIGAAFRVPKHKEWATYARWSKQYGPILGFRVFGQNVVVLHTAEAANELLENRAAKSSDRPLFPMLEL